MKRLFIILSFSIIPLLSLSQNEKIDYSGFKPCNDCFEQWHSSNGISEGNERNERQIEPKNRNHEFARQTRNFVRGIVVPIIGIFTAALSYVIFKKVTDATNGI